MREIPQVSERALGKIPSTTVTNELARAVQAMAPIIGGGQVFPPRVGSGGGGTLPTGTRQFQIYQMLTDTQAGWDYFLIHP